MKKDYAALVELSLYTLAGTGHDVPIHVWEAPETIRELVEQERKRTRKAGDYVLDTLLSTRNKQMEPWFGSVQAEYAVLLDQLMERGFPKTLFELTPAWQPGSTRFYLMVRWNKESATFMRRLFIATARAALGRK
jgi:hypothetical protein